MIDKLHYISQQNESISHIEAIKQALDADCRWIQLRVKHQPQNQVLQIALEAKKLCNNYGAKLIINDFPQVALEVGAYGLHLGLSDMSVSEARTLIGKQMIIGGTANTFEHIQLRIDEGADYIGLGPFRFTATKEKLSPILGIEGYYSIMQKMWKAGLQIPLIAIGGIELEDIASLIKTGIYGVAVSGGLTKSSHKQKLVKRMYEELNNRPEIVYDDEII